MRRKAFNGRLRGCLGLCRLCNRLLLRLIVISDEVEKCHCGFLDFEYPRRLYFPLYALGQFALVQRAPGEQLRLGGLIVLIARP